jgi:hypothetical protein
MIDTPEPGAQRAKKPYSEPTLIQVPLKPEETVLGSCKTSGSGAGPGGTTCHSPSACSSLAS